MSEEQYQIYIDALGFNCDRYRMIANRLKSIVDHSKTIQVTSGNDENSYELKYDGGMEPCKLNIGDYTGMENVGGTYPIGEVFSEAKELSGVNGKISIFAFPNPTRLLEFAPSPILLTIRESQIVDWDRSTSPPHFNEMLDLIRDGEGGKIYVREFGMGLNESMGRAKYLNDITAFERQCGMHISIGQKHTVYKKKGIKAKKTRFHLDLFVNLQRLVVDDVVIFENGKWTADKTTVMETGTATVETASKILESVHSEAKAKLAVDESPDIQEAARATPAPTAGSLEKDVEERKENTA